MLSRRRRRPLLQLLCFLRVVRVATTRKKLYGAVGGPDFLIEKYKENFRNIGKKGGLRNKKQLFLYLTDALNEEFECSLVCSE
ncbi:hypothetical protein MTO96_038503 [Rhipicephalus appendiculatus]